MPYGQVLVDTVKDSLNNVLAPASAVFRNRIINGAMVIDQRNAGASVTPTANAYTLDRWLANVSTASKFSVQQSTTAPAGFTNSTLITSTSAYSVVAGDYQTFQQRIEAYNMSDAGWGTSDAKTFTLSFWVRSSLTGTFGGSFYFPASTGRTYPFSYTISTANTWTQISITIAGDTFTNTAPTTNNNYVIVQWGLGVGSTYTTATTGWQSGNFASPTSCVNILGTSGATFYITGVQLEVGTNATSFDYRPYGTELALCQRYCCAFDNRVYSQSYYKFGTATWTGTTSAMVNVSFPVAMRVPPTSMTASTVNTVFWVESGTTNFTSCTMDQVSDKAGTFLLSSGSGGQPAGYGGRALSNATAAAYVIFNAEL